MRCSIVHIGVVVLLLNGTVDAAMITFNSNPFDGSTAPTTPGRQIVGGELFTDFDIATDVFVFDAGVFGISGINFANVPVGNLPMSGVNNVIVLRMFDFDGNPMTSFGVGNAANLIAYRLTSSKPGFFVYFNQGLDLPRLVFSTDLNDNTADLKVLARLTNLSGQSGRDAFPLFTAANFATTTTQVPTEVPTQVPEPSTFSLMIAAGGLLAARSALHCPRSPK